MSAIRTGQQSAGSMRLIELLRTAPTNRNLTLLGCTMLSMIENQPRERSVIISFAKVLSKALAMLARAEYRTGDYLLDDLKGWVAREQAESEAALRRAFT